MTDVTYGLGKQQLGAVVRPLAAGTVEGEKLSAPLITHLRHVAIAMPDIERQLAFYRDLWGLTPAVSDSSVHFLAAEGSPENYIVRLRKSDDKRMDLVAFGAATPADVDALAVQLAAQGV